MIRPECGKAPLSADDGASHARLGANRGLKFKNPEAPAVTREAEEEWGW
jgi:hypothetical protein